MAQHGPEHVEVRLSGSGGQGILLAAALLAEAALASGRQVVQTQSYGPEARGGASKAEVIISTTEIDYPEVDLPDVMLCLSQTAFDKYAAEAKPNGTIYYDSGLVTPSSSDGALQLGAPFTQLASERLGKAVVANIIAIGALAAHSQVVAKGALLGALENRMPAKLLPLNRKALELGFVTELRDISGGG